MKTFKVDRMKTFKVDRMKTFKVDRMETFPGWRCFNGLTPSLGCGHEGPGLLTSSQGRISLQEDRVGGGCIQVVDLLPESGLTDGLLQLCTVWF